MPRYKVTMLFGEGVHGWSESWYTQDAIDLTLAREQATRVMTARSLLLGATATIDAVRFSEVGVRRSTALFFQNAVTESAPGYPDFPSACIVGEVSGVDPYRRVYYLRGYPDNWVIKSTDGSDPRITDAAKGAFRGYCSALNAELWQFKVTQKGGVIGQGVDIKQYGTVNAHLAITAPGLGAAVGSKVSIKKTKTTTAEQMRRVNKTFKCLGVNGDIYELDAPAAVFPDVGLYAGGKAYLKLPDYTPVQKGELIRPGERRAGRAFFVSPGRRSKRK